MRRPTLLLLLTAVAALLAACNSGNHAASSLILAGDTLTTKASLLTLVDCDSFMIAEVKNPWDTASMMGRYALVARDREIPEAVSADRSLTVVRTPVASSLVYSSVHAGAVDELGAVDAITGVADASYFKIPSIVEGLKNGRVTDVGQSMSPSAEKIAALQPEVILVSPFENAGHGLIEKSGIPIIEMADYMENTPEGRAEWIKLLGALYGKEAAADSIFTASSTRYRDLAAQAARAEDRPRVICEQVTDGVWYLPGGHSYMARMLADAGADYPWSDDISTGSLQLDLPTVLDRAHDADIWLIRTFGYDLTLDALKKNNLTNREFRAFNHGGVYACNTEATTLFEDFPFHPERLLRDYIIIFHPGLLGDEQPRYYKQVR